MAFLRLIDRVFTVVVSVLVAALMLLTFTDVFLREAFGSPLIVAHETTTIGIAGLVYLGLPVVSARDEHITISLFETLFRGRAQRIKRGLVALLLAFLSAALAYQLWIHAGKLGKEELMFLKLDKLWISYAMSVMSGVTALVFVVRAALIFQGRSFAPATRVEI